MRIQTISIKANQEVAPYCFVNIHTSAVIHKGDNPDEAADKLKEFACKHLEDFKTKINNLGEAEFRRVPGSQKTIAQPEDNVPY